VKVEGETLASTGNYTIRQGPLLLKSGGDANLGIITDMGQVDWYFFTAGAAGEYKVMREDDSDKAGGTYYSGGNVKVSAYKYDATPIPALVEEDEGYKIDQGVSIGNLAAGETIYVKAEAQSSSVINGTYGIRYRYVP
jgi:hypothetical protein